MIFYGSSHFQEKWPVLAARLHERIVVIADAQQGGEWSLDELRTVLIEAGQLEQAVMDALSALPGNTEAQRLQTGVQALTDAAARAFCRCWMQENENDSGRNESVEVADLTALAEEIVALLHACDRKILSADADLTINIPEGFAFYTLYPEAYCVAARQWAQDHAQKQEGAVLLVGLRSIGTSLSAVVGATLQQVGRSTRRITVRPDGPPFERRVLIPNETVRDAVWALVVDEGPGLSGSSMAATAEALAKAGIAAEAVSFLPGHGGEPGSKAGESVRRWWQRTSRYVTSLPNLRWGPQDLAELLAARTATITGTLSAPVLYMEDVGGGEWRRQCYAAPESWPAICPPFERAKYLCHREDGTAILWKFAGLAIRGEGSQTEADFARLRHLARCGWTPAPLDSVAGFIALPWLSGKPLTLQAADAPTLARIGRYIADAALPPLSPKEQKASLARLGEMLYWNVWEALGDKFATQTRPWTQRALALVSEGTYAAYGDGRLAPHEWLRTADGRLWKTDCTGHQQDHSVVGPQSVGWDVAGAMVEWDLDMAKAQPLFAGFSAGDGMLPHPDLLLFYRLAYAAFRLGQMTLCEGMVSSDSGEQARCHAAAERFRQAIGHLLPSADSPDV